MRAVVLAVLVVLLLLPGCLNDFEGDNLLQIHGVDVSAPVIRSGTADIVVTVELDNAGSRSGDVALVVKAVRTDTGLLESTAEVAVGAVAKDTTQTVEARLDLPRDTGYRFEVAVFEDGQVLRSRVVTVGDLSLLPANVHETGVQVAAMDFLVQEVADRVTVQADLYITNEGSQDSEPIRIQVKAREVSTGLLSDVSWLDIPSTPPEETHRHAVMLDVPDGYNYEVEAVLWDGDFIVGRHVGHVQLLPTFEKPEDTQIVVQDPDLDDFVRSRDGAHAADSEGASTPGPTPILLLAALLAVVAWRRTHG